MTIVNAAHLSAAFGLVLQVGTLVFLVWLFRYTRVKPVLYNALWRIVSLAWGPAGASVSAKPF